jgi:hypothetical protein
MKTKKVLLYLAGLIALSSIGLNIFQYLEIRKFSDNLPSRSLAQEKFADAHIRKTTGTNPDAGYVRELEYQLSASEEELDMVSEQLSRELDKASQKDPLSNPVLNKTMMASIDRDYSLIYGPMDLTPQDLQKFKNIVAEWRIANNNRNPLERADASPEEKEAIEKLRQETREKYEREFIELMGEKKFKIYDDFKNSGSESFLLKTYLETLSPEEKIGDADAYTLISSMYRVRKDIEEVKALDTGNDNSLDTDKYDYISFMERNVNLYKKYEEIIGDVLSTTQADKFKAYLIKNRESYELQLKYLQDEVDKTIVKPQNR